MTSADREYDDIISRALHAIVDPVEPAGDGLARIRDQIGQPWLTRRLALLISDCLTLAWQVVTRCESGVLALRSRLADGRILSSQLKSARSWPGLVLSRIVPANSRHGHHAARRGRMRAGGDLAGAALAWARPALAVAAAVLVVAAGYYGLGQIRQTIAPSSSTLGGQAPSGPGGGAPLTSGQSPTSPAAGPGGSSKQRPQLSATPGSGMGTTAPVPCSSGVPAPSPSASATPPQTPDPSSDPTPSALPTATDTPTPADSTPSSAPVTSDSPTGSPQDGTAAGGTQQAGATLGTGVALGSGTGERHGASGWRPVVGTDVPAMAATCPPATPSSAPSPGPTTPAPITTPSLPVDSSPPVP